MTRRCWIFVVCLVCGGGSIYGQSPEPISNQSTSDPTSLPSEWLDSARHPVTGLLSKGLRPEESRSYFAILDHARKLTASQLRDAARLFQQQRRTLVKDDPEYRYYFRKTDAPFPTFVDLFRAPESYHGKLVTFRGHLRRLVTFSVEPNPFGFERLHEAWLYVGDAQQNPIVIVCSQLPDGIPTGSDVLVDAVSVTGYFFKRYGYEDRSGQPRFAPLLLAHQLEWMAPQARQGLLSGASGFGIIISCGLCFGIAWLVWSRRRRRSPAEVATESFETTPPLPHR